MKKYLVGFRCQYWRYGCNCNVDTSLEIKNNFKQKYNINYDEFCYYDLIIAENDKDAFDNAYSLQGATEDEIAREIWRYIEVIDEVVN
jgi:hypothetical protein